MENQRTRAAGSHGSINKMQSQLPWGEQTTANAKKSSSAGLDKCRVVAVQKNLIFKSVVTKEFMVLKSNNVRAVSPGAQVVVSAMPETDTEEERPVAKVSAIIGSCIFVGNVKITDIDQAKELFRLHLTSTQDVQAMRSNNQHIIGWHFQDFALYTSPKWIIGSVRQENTF